ncbi:MAG: ABC transporter ATP-binding protein [Campylobacterales bacterium]
MIKNYQKIWALLTLRERKRAGWLLAMMIVMAFMEVVGVASVMPFLAVLGSPQMVEKNAYLSAAYSALGFESTRSFLVALGLFTLAVLLVSAAVRIVTHYALFRFTSMRQHSISSRLLSGYLRQPYLFFLKRNTSEMSKTILSETGQVVSQSIRPVINLMVYVLVSVVLLAFLVSIDPVLALMLAGVFGGFYALMYLTVRRRLGRMGAEIRSSNAQRFKIASETLGGIKDLKVLGREEAYLKAFHKPSLTFSRHQATAQTLAQVPKFLIEVIAFGAILAIALYALSAEGADLGKLLPVLGLYALGAMRLKPAMDNIYTSVSQLRFGGAVLDGVLKDIRDAESRAVSLVNDWQRLPLEDAIFLKNVSFSYPNGKSPALRDISFSISANTTVGVIGTTGAGKSTLIDLLLGLIQPDKGELLIDGQPLTAANVRQWQNSIGYVPQHIFLADDTVAANIAFGVPNAQINHQAVEDAARMAQVHEFVVGLPDGYDTEIGERGVRLSGGQRQRLGIARALYHNPDLLVLDEATSALDNETEAEVMKAIDAMGGQKTIIMIAHRLSTVERCDQLIRLEHGRVVDISIKGANA